MAPLVRGVSLADILYDPLGWLGADMPFSYAAATAAANTLAERCPGWYARIDRLRGIVFDFTRLLDVPPNMTVTPVVAQSNSAWPIPLTMPSILWLPQHLIAREDREARWLYRVFVDTAVLLCGLTETADLMSPVKVATAMLGGSPLPSAAHTAVYADITTKAKPPVSGRATRLGLAVPVSQRLRIANLLMALPPHWAVTDATFVWVADRRAATLDRALAGIKRHTVMTAVNTKVTPYQPIPLVFEDNIPKGWTAELGPVGAATAATLAWEAPWDEG